ncbi:hypothetical protein NKG05_27160 [Oerskovia sp. M15]
MTGQRGWVDETNRTLAGDMTVEGKIWFAPPAFQTAAVQETHRRLASTGSPYPFDKAHAIRVATHRIGDPAQPVFPLRAGESPRFSVPEFARHDDTAWTVGNLDVQIGSVALTDDKAVDDFNAIVMWAFNFWTGNLLLAATCSPGTSGSPSPPWSTVRSGASTPRSGAGRSTPAMAAPRRGHLTRFFDGRYLHPGLGAASTEVQAAVAAEEDSAVAAQVEAEEEALDAFVSSHAAAFEA